MLSKNQLEDISNNCVSSTAKDSANTALVYRDALMQTREVLNNIVWRSVNDNIYVDEATFEETSEIVSKIDKLLRW